MSSLTFWNTLPERIDPTLFTIGGSSFFQWGSSADGSGFPLRYYGLMYIAAIITTLLVLERLRKKEPLPFKKDETESLVTYIVIGVMLGGRLGYVIFYNLQYYLLNPLEILWPFSNGSFVGIAGMSYHGGIIGFAVGAYLFFKKHSIPFLVGMNPIALAGSLGYTWGRVGNFLNGELYGKPTQSPIGMRFPTDPTGLIRHPSQLYEAALEGVLLFLSLSILYRYPLFKNKMLALYISGYGIARFTVEFFREPDSHIGFNALGLSRGQMLSTGMIITGIAILLYQLKREKTV